MAGKSVTATVALFLLSVVSLTWAAVGIGKATIHDSHPGKCFNEETDSYYAPGEFWQLKGCGKATCTQISQSSAQHMMISFESCGVVSVQPPCYLVQDFTKDYPACCHQVVCPESAENEENDKSDGASSSDELISGLNRTASSSVNDLDGAAVHFSLARDEDNLVDRSERNDLQSLDDEYEQDKQDSVGEDSFELIQPRRIPVRFQFASLYDIGSGHEQRLNDVDAHEDYQLV